MPETTNADEPVVRARGLCKSYLRRSREVHVLKHADLIVMPGESVAILGASGAGKSTLLHILGGMDKPDRGMVEVLGRDVYRMSGGARTRLRASAIGFVFQSYHLLPELDVVENVVIAAMACRPLGMVGRSARRRAEALIEAVGLKERRKHRPMELSGGEQQRVAIARALVNRPRLVLADEPTGNLDEKTGDHVLENLFRLVRDDGHSMVIVTHNAHTAQLCDRRLQLVDGALL
jgi:ABC-type lipoprotein export system ATPase subunit